MEIEVFHDDIADEFVVDDGMRELGARSTKQAAKQLAKQKARPGDRILVFTKGNRLDEDLLVGEDDVEQITDQRGGRDDGLFGAGMF